MFVSSILLAFVSSFSRQIYTSINFSENPKQPSIHA
ncbi:unnamed protein product [Brassica rapa]|uniref:Uncharacterized protein n=1 Tax=Brassica campestris TaxID=3711 RepID=A0A8D9GKD0_BRACM|nr:unnamed protein product [Brassica rapa]